MGSGKYWIRSLGWSGPTQSFVKMTDHPPENAFFIFEFSLDMSQCLQMQSTFCLTVGHSTSLQTDFPLVNPQGFIRSSFVGQPKGFINQGIVLDGRNPTPQKTPKLPPKFVNNGIFDDDPSHEAFHTLGNDGTLSQQSFQNNR